MADVKVCDRYGKRVEINGVWPVYVHNYRSVLGMETSLYKYTYDLCGDCTKKLFEFMKDTATEATDE